MKKESLYRYTLHLADNTLILGQRLGEWCGHGPVLEQDIALTNIALDLIGQSRLLYQYAAKQKGDDSSEDDLAFLRKEHEYYNCLLTEQSNGDFGVTLLRQFLFDAFQYDNYRLLSESSDETLAAIAKKSLKEVSYHLDFSSGWVIRLGDGTEESHGRMLDAAQLLWRYTEELYTPTKEQQLLTDQGIAPDWEELQASWQQRVKYVMAEATLPIPEVKWMQHGGKTGKHTEQMGYILTELQYMQRTYPEAQW